MNKTTRRKLKHTHTGTTHTITVISRTGSHEHKQGTITEVRHFRLKGLPEYYAGLKGGPTGEPVFNDSVFERTRENMNEFGGCALAGKSVRDGLQRKAFGLRFGSFASIKILSGPYTH